MLREPSKKLQEQMLSIMMRLPTKVMGKVEQYQKNRALSNGGASDVSDEVRMLNAHGVDFRLDSSQDVQNRRKRDGAIVLRWLYDDVSVYLGSSS